MLHLDFRRHRPGARLRFAGARRHGGRPREGADGVVPKKDDFSITVGLGWDSVAADMRPASESTVVETVEVEKEVTVVETVEVEITSYGEAPRYSTRTWI